MVSNIDSFLNFVMEVQFPSFSMQDLDEAFFFVKDEFRFDRFQLVNPFIIYNRGLNWSENLAFWYLIKFFNFNDSINNVLEVNIPTQYFNLFILPSEQINLNTEELIGVKKNDFYVSQMAYSFKIANRLQLKKQFDLNNSA